jgi:hypothetical protein
MVNRTDLPAVTKALESAGFVYQDLLGVAMFLDGPNGSPRDAVHLLFAAKRFDHTTRLLRPGWI